MRRFFIVLSLAFILPLPLSAATLEDIDQQLATAESPAELLKVETVIREQPRQQPADLAWRLAKVYYKLGKEAGRKTRKEYFASCVEQADQAIKLNDRSAGGYFFKGVCEGKLGEIDGIWSSLGIIEPLKRNMETVIKLDPAFEQGGPHRALGKMYHELPLVLGGDLDKSLGHLREAVRLGPKFGENHYLLAETYYAKGEYPLAEKSLNTLLGVTQDLQKNHEIRALRRDATELLKKITKKSPNAQGIENP